MVVLAALCPEAMTDEEQDLQNGVEATRKGVWSYDDDPVDRSPRKQKA